jgi:hypothetical protein
MRNVEYLFNDQPQRPRLKAEDYYNFIAGYFGNVVGQPTQ